MHVCVRARRPSPRPGPYSTRAASTATILPGRAPVPAAVRVARLTSNLRPAVWQSRGTTWMIVGTEWSGGRRPDPVAAVRDRRRGAVAARRCARAPAKSWWDRSRARVIEVLERHPGDPPPSRDRSASPRGGRGGDPGGVPPMAGHVVDDAPVPGAGVEQPPGRTWPSTRWRRCVRMSSMIRAAGGRHDQPAVKWRPSSWSRARSRSSGRGCWTAIPQAWRPRSSNASRSPLAAIHGTVRTRGSI